MKIIVTGGHGFLGRSLVTSLNVPGNEILIVYRNSPEIQIKNIKYVNYNDIKKIQFKPDLVFHIGAFVPPSNDVKYKNDLIKFNVDFTAILTKTFRNAKIIFASTVSVYESNGSIITETSLEDPSSLYAFSKLEAESLVRSLDRFVIVRFSSIYGISMRPNTIIPKMIEMARLSGDIKVISDGSRLQDYLFVRDAVKFLTRAVDAENGIYLGVSGESISNLSLAKEIATFFGARISFVEGGQGPSYRYDNSWTKSNLHLGSLCSLGEGLKLMDIN